MFFGVETVADLKMKLKPILKNVEYITNKENLHKYKINSDEIIDEIMTEIEKYSEMVSK